MKHLKQSNLQKQKANGGYQGLWWEGENGVFVEWVQSFGLVT